MTDPKWLTWALDQARRDLIDLTRRNRLLHAPLGGKRPWCTAITGHTPDQLFEKLYRQENFRGYAFKAYEEEFKRTATARYRNTGSNNSFSGDGFDAAAPTSDAARS